MAARLAAKMIVSALIRQAESAGGNGMVLARGEPVAGSILIQLEERGTPGDLLERVLDPSGSYAWRAVGPADPTERGDYVARRRRIDPDLWLVEIDAKDARALVANLPI